MTDVTVCERVLTDDVLRVPDHGYRLAGGYAAALEYHTFRNPWADDEHVRRFRTLEAAAAFIERRYGDDANWDALGDLAGIFRP